MPNCLVRDLAGGDQRRCEYVRFFQGCLGKRTKFQEFETAQLLLVVSKGGERSTAPVDASKEETTPRNGLPKVRDKIRIGSTVKQILDCSFDGR